MAAEEGADMVGLIFARSPRRVDVTTAKEIIRRLPRAVEPVGVFMDQPLAEVKSILNDTGLRTAQLHGDETPDFARSLGVNVIKTFTSFTDDTLETLRRFDVFAFLLDVPKSETARTKIDLDWATVAKKYGRIMASGRLTAESAFDVVRKLRPWAVDVCSFTEIVPGRKDRAKVRAFIQSVKVAHQDSERIRVKVR